MNAMRWKVIIYMAALFFAGVITGASVMSRMNPTSQSLKVGRSDEIATKIRDRLVSRLDLTSDQQKKIEPVIQKATLEMEASHLDCLNRISKSIADLHTALAAELTPGQREQLKQLDAEKLKTMRDKYNYPPTAPRPATP